jgi:acyl carrier protein
MDTFDRVKRIVADELGLDWKSIALDAEIEADLGADSLHMVQIMMAVEEEFGTRVAEEDAIDLKSCRQIADYIELRASEQQQSMQMIKA